MEQGEKLSTVTTALGSAIKTALNPDAIEKPTTTTVDMALVEMIIEDFPAMAKKAAKQTIEKYGPPDEATPSTLTWYNNGPWKRTEVFRHEIPHNFPQPHTDVIKNTIDYKVPDGYFDELAKFDGSVMVDKTRGEVSSRCDMEPANFLSINLMHDIVTGKYTAEQAREVYGEVTSAFLMNREAPYAVSLQFTPPQGGTGYTDEVKIAGAMLHQAGEKVKDTFSSDDKG